MDSLHLISEIRDFLGHISKNLELENPKGGYSSVNVFEYYLPDKTNVSEEYPYIVIQPGGDEDDVSSDEFTTKLNLVLGVYENNSRSQGMKDLMHLASFLRLEFKRKQLFGAFSITGKIKFTPFSEQVYPYFHGLIELEFDGPPIQIERGMYGEHF